MCCSRQEHSSLVNIQCNFYKRNARRACKLQPVYILMTSPGNIGLLKKRDQGSPDCMPAKHVFIIDVSNKECVLQCPEKAEDATYNIVLNRLLTITRGKTTFDILGQHSQLCVFCTAQVCKLFHRIHQNANKQGPTFKILQRVEFSQASNDMLETFSSCFGKLLHSSFLFKAMRGIVEDF